MKAALFIAFALAPIVAVTSCGVSGETPTDATSKDGGPGRLPDGATVLADGAILLTDGAVVLSDGAIVQPDGAVVQPDGAVVQPDGAIVTPDAAPVFVPTGAPGTLDTSFATTGYVLGDNPGALATNDRGAGVAIDSQGRIVVAGDATVGATGYSVVWRFTDPGAVDTSFGSSGTFSASGSAGDAYERLSGVCVDANDRPYATGGTNTAGKMLLYRLTNQGALDPGFHGTGYLTTTNTTGTGWDNGVAVACPLGGVVVGGTGGYDVAAWRFLSSGDVDTAGFHAPNGFVNSHIVGDEGFGHAVTIDGEGRILVAGYHEVAGGFVWRYSSAGVLDGTFALGAIVPSGVAVDASGRIYVSFAIGGADNHGSVMRLTAAGAPDSSFGANGVLSLPPDAAASVGTATRAAAVALDSKGRVVVVGTQGLGNIDVDNETKLAVWRVTAAGALDGTFGTGGLTTLGHTGGLPGYPAEGAAVAVDRFDRPVVTGATYAPTYRSRAAIWRFNP